MSSNLKWHPHNIDKYKRASIKGQKPVILWFTGLSGSGKSTIANGVEEELFKRGYHTYLLDGDNIRLGLNRDLGFGESDRVENIRRIGEVSKLFVDAGLIVLSAFISPYKADRESIRKSVNEDEFIEIFVDTPLEVCKARDPKGLYKKAIEGKIANFTGISSPYEVPLNPEIIIDGSTTDIKEAIDIVINYLETKGYLNAR